MTKIHLVYIDGEERLKVFNPCGSLAFTCECRNQTTAHGYGNDGKCPPGTYDLLPPEARSNVAEGHWFIPLADVPGRVGIGLHGGGTGLPGALTADRQGWQVTHGCLRLQNEDLARVVSLLTGPAEITVC